MADILYCPRCGLTGDEVGQCGSADVLPCPTPMPVDFETVILIKCGPCGKVRATTVHDVMKGLTHQRASGCLRQVCEAKVMLPTPVTQVSKQDTPRTRAPWGNLD